MDMILQNHEGRYSDIALMTDVEPRVPMTLDQLRARNDPDQLIQSFDRIADIIATSGYGRMTMADFDRWEAEHHAEIYG